MPFQIPRVQARTRTRSLTEGNCYETTVIGPQRAAYVRPGNAISTGRRKANSSKRGTTAEYSESEMLRFDGKSKGTGQQRSLRIKKESVKSKKRNTDSGRSSITTRENGRRKRLSGSSNRVDSGKKTLISLRTRFLLTRFLRTRSYNRKRDSRAGRRLGSYGRRNESLNLNLYLKSSLSLSLSL